MSKALSGQAKSRLAKQIALLSSDREGEVVAAARAVIRTLRSEGADIHDLVRPLCAVVNHSSGYVSELELENERLRQERREFYNAWDHRTAELHTQHQALFAANMELRQLRRELDKAETSLSRCRATLAGMKTKTRAKAEARKQMLIRRAAAGAGRRKRVLTPRVPQPQVSEGGA